VVAVMPCEAGSYNLADMARAVPELLATALTRDKNLTLVEREKLDKILAEQSLGASGLVDPDKAVQIGKLIGARFLVLPRTYTVGDQIFVSAKVVNAETGKVMVASKAARAAGANATMLSGLIAEDVQRLLDTASKEPAGPSDDDRYKQQLADIAKALGDRKRPTVTVVVPEEQLRHLIPDPAVKTELCYMLRKLKFRVIENDSPLLDQWSRDYFAGKATKLPAEVGDIDVVIYGGAFAETTGQRGNLVSARARLELSAIDPKTSEIIAVDKATASAADLSESVAGKSALANATLSCAKDFITELGTSWGGAKK
jgi:curli biogenesis system outer membrane secretion channel CsgG